VTAYSCEGITSDEERSMNCPNGHTALGTQPKPGRTVACPASLLGKTIVVAGVGERYCEDRGGAITEGRLDLYAVSIAEARQFGAKELAYWVK
jgi:3D (Asp-Asp-Asp) domain-containing protein